MQASPRHIRRTINRARGAWYRLGVPRDVRGRLAAELRVELEDAAARGLPIEFVVGNDVTTFAASRAPRDGRRSVGWLGSEIALALVVTPTLIALLFAALYDRPVGFYVHELVWVLGIALGSASLQAGRERRGLDDRRDWPLLGATGLVVFSLGGFLLSLVLGISPRFVTVPAGLAWGTLAVSAIAQVVISRRRRARWRDAVEVSA